MSIRALIDVTQHRIPPPEDDMDDAIYQNIITILDKPPQDDGLQQVFDLLMSALPRLTNDEFQKCITEHLDKLLAFSRGMPQSQYDLAMCIATTLLERKKTNDAMYFTAIALNIADEHNFLTAPERAETLASQIFLSFLDEERERIHAYFDQSTNDSEKFSKGLQNLHRLTRFCSRDKQLELVVSLYRIAQKVKNTLPASRHSLDPCQDDLVQGLSLEKVHPPLSSIVRKYRLAIEEYRKEYGRDTADVRADQRRRTAALLNFFSLLIEDIFLMIGPPPCQYSLCAMGSIAREEVTPYSDLEWILLIEDESQAPFFEKMMTVFEMQLYSLGETAHRFYPQFTAYTFTKGMCSDRGDEPLIGTPIGLINAHCGISQRMLAPRTMPYTMAHLKTIHTSSPQLLADFEARYTKIFRKDNRHTAGEALITHRYSEHVSSIISRDNKPKFKEQFIEPLFYLLADIGLLVGVRKSNTLDLLDEFHVRNIFSQTAINQLKQSVRLLYNMRVALSTGKAIDRRLLNQIEVYVLSPLYDATQELLQGEQLSRISRCDILTAHLRLLTQTETTGTGEVEKFTEHRVEHFAKYLKENNISPIPYYTVLSNHPTRIEYVREAFISVYHHTKVFETLIMIPNPFGERMVARVRRNAFFQVLETMTCDRHEIPGDVRVEITSPFLPNKKALLKHSVIAVILDEEGNIRKECAGTNSRVAFHTTERGSLHFKQQPSNPSAESPFHPGRERAANELMLRLFGRGTSVGEVFKFTVSLKTGKTKTYFVWISATIPGKTLGESTPATLRQIDSVQLSELFLSLPLLQPGDMRPANCIVTETVPREVISIDNDVSWIPPMTKELFGSLKCNLYTVLPFLFQNHVLDKNAVEAFLALRPGPLLLKWFESMRDYNETIEKFFPSSKDFTPLCLFDRGTGANLFTQFCAIQTFLRKNHPHMISGIDIISCIVSMQASEIVDIGPAIHKKYKAALQIAGTPSDQVKHVTGRGTSRSMSMTASSAVLYKSLPRTGELRAQISPQHGIDELEYLIAVNFNDLHFSQDRDGISTLSKGFKEIRDETTQQVVLRSLAVHKYSKLNLSHADALDDQLLEMFIKSSGEALVSLDLRHCPKITYQSIRFIKRQCPLLEELYVSHCPSLAKFTIADLLPKLKVLHISDCKSLETVSMTSTTLRFLKANNNPNLRTYRLSLSPSCIVETFGSHPYSHPFGAAQWKHYFGLDIQLPKDHTCDPCELLAQPDPNAPFWQQALLRDKYLLILVPNLTRKALNQVITRVYNRQKNRCLLVPTTSHIPISDQEPYWVFVKWDHSKNLPVKPGGLDKITSLATNEQYLLRNANTIESHIVMLLQHLRTNFTSPLSFKEAEQFREDAQILKKRAEAKQALAAKEAEPLPQGIRPRSEKGVVAAQSKVRRAYTDDYAKLCLQNFDLNDEDISKVLDRRICFIRDIDLSANKLTHIPLQLRELAEHCFSVDLSCNQLVDILDDELQYLPNKISVLYLSNTGMHSLPRSIHTLRQLRGLDLSNNSLSELPDEIAELGALETLDLRKNQFTVFPPSLLKLRRLEELQFSKNKLSSLPKNMGEMLALKKLSVEDNEPLSTLPISLKNTAVTTIKISGTKIPEHNRKAILSNHSIV